MSANLYAAFRERGIFLHNQCVFTDQLAAENTKLIYPNMDFKKKKNYLSS